MQILRVVDRITDAAAFIGVCAIMPLVVIMTFEVVSRYAFNEPTSWAFELSWMLMGVIFIMGIAYALRRDEHVRVDLIYGTYSPRRRAALDVFGFLLVLPCIYLAGTHMALYALEAYRSGEVSGASAWNPVLWPFRAALAFGLIVFLLQLIAELVRALRVLITGVIEARDHV